MVRDVPALTQALVDARHSGKALRAADWEHAVRSEAEAYAVQEGVAAALGWASAPGQPVRHWKSGAPGRAGPFSHAPLDPAGVSQGETAGPASKTWPRLGLEAEVALRLGCDISPAQARALRPGLAPGLVDAVCIAVELVGSRWQEGLAAPALLKMADHQCHAGLLLGPWLAWREGLDWARLRWSLQQPGEPALSRQGGHALDDPAWLLAPWLQHLSRHGATVPAGTIVTTGAWGGGLLPASAASLAGEAALSLSFEGLGCYRFRL